MDFKLNIQLFGDNNNDSHRGYMKEKSHKQKMRAKGYKYEYGGKWFKKESEYKAYKKAKQQEAMMDSGGGHGATDNGRSEANMHNPNVSGRTKTTKKSGTLDPKNSLNLGFQQKAPSKNYNNFDGFNKSGSIHTPNKGGTNLNLRGDKANSGAYDDGSKTANQWRNELNKISKTPVTGKPKLDFKLSKENPDGTKQVGTPSKDVVAELNRNTNTERDSMVSKGGAIGAVAGGLLAPNLMGAGYFLGNLLNPTKIKTKKTAYSSLADALDNPDGDQRRGGNEAGHGNFVGGAGGGAGGGADLGTIAKEAQKKQEESGSLEPPILEEEVGTPEQLARQKMYLLNKQRRDNHKYGLGDVLSVFGKKKGKQSLSGLFAGGY